MYARLSLLFVVVFGNSLSAEQLPVVTNVDVQPLKVHTERLRDALKYLGTPLDESTAQKVESALAEENGAKAVTEIQAALDPLCLAGVNINPESRVKVAMGNAKRELDENGWRLFLVKVHNEAGVTAALQAASPQAAPVPNATSLEGKDRWLEISMFGDRPLSKELNGLALEYRPILLYSRDSGKRAAVIAFNVGQGTQDIGFRNDVALTFDCRPATEVTFDVKDENGKPTTACFEIRDSLGRIYPAQNKRLAPDFFFHPQIYRTDGEKLRLPQGEYTVACTRGPEYLKQEKKITVGESTKLSFKLDRWVDPAKSGWWSGDHHIHAAGCAHYTKPSEGVHAPDMMKHCLGEDLKVGANLTWGPCFDYQKQFFTGKDSKVSQYPYLLRYDVEVSGFGSHQSGHLCLLRLKEQIHPGGDSKHHWPTLCLNTLKWAQKQGAVAGPAHSGWGLFQSTDQLPTYELPPYDGIGANEYIVDVTHDVEGPNGTTVPAVDFLSMCDTPYVWEMNIWYHTLNCGYRCRVSGETDFPCIYGERVGLGRSYVKLDKLTYDAWCEGISLGKCYVADGRSHLIDFEVDGTELGTNGSEVRLAKAGKITAKAKVAAYLNEKPDESIRKRSYTEKPYWHVERARIDDSRDVLVELVVNGYPVEKQRIKADGTMHDVAFQTEIPHSSWVAMRILGTSHTNPMFVLVDDKPIRASKRSAQWCLDGVEKCWTNKRRFIDADEIQDARDAYEHARVAYKKILEESVAE